MSGFDPESTVVIDAAARWRFLNLRELARYSDLLATFVWRDIKVRYTQTMLGASWAVLQPFLMMVVFSFFFSNMPRLDTEIPYPVFAFVALVPWTYFATAVNQSSQSVVKHAGVITKVYFPRLLLPVASVLSGLVDFTVSFVVLLALMLFFGIVPTVGAVAVPLLVILTVLSALSVGLWFAALNVMYRDIMHIVPFFIQLGLFLSPVIYSSHLVEERFPALYPIYMLNPMAGVLEGFRWALLGAAPPPTSMLALSCVSVIALFVGGIWFFRRTERWFADLV